MQELRFSSKIDSLDIVERSDKLLRTASNRYQITVQVANRAKRYRYEEFDSIDDPKMKPVIRAILEMSDELTQPNIISNSILSLANKNNSNGKGSSPGNKGGGSDGTSSSSGNQDNSNPESSFSSSSDKLPSFNTVINGVNIEVENNDDLSNFKNKSKFEAWNEVITWITEWFAGPESIWDFKSARKSVETLQKRLNYLPLREIAHILVIQKTLQIAGINVLNSIPCAEDIISALADYDLPHLAKVSVEIIYQIGIIYGRKDPEKTIDIIQREVEILSIFSSALCIDKAIENGLDFLKLGWFGNTAVKASTKALFIIYLGYSACAYYEEQRLHQSLSEVVHQNESYLDNLIEDHSLSERLITTYITDDIEENLVRYSVYEDYEERPETQLKDESFESQYQELEKLLRARQWKKADELTFDILLLIGNRRQKGYLTKSEVETLSCDKLSKIDYLWRLNSDDKFGFSVQTEIYKKIGGTEKYNLEKWREFGNKLGWRKNERWLSYHNMMNSLHFDSLPKGYFPARGVGGLKYVGSYRLIYTHFDHCLSQLT